MGYKRKTYKLVWPEGHELHGLEVRMKGLSIEDLGAVAGLQDLIGDKPGVELFEPLVDVFSRNVQGWNLEEDDGNPVPTDAGTVREQDARMLLQVVMTWADKAAAVAPPLKQPSSSGQPSLEASLPMEPL